MIKMQFSKKLCVYSWGLLTMTVLMEFALQWSHRGSMNDIIIKLISFVTVFINGGYITQNMVRDTSLNKNGLRIPAGGGKHYLGKPQCGADKEEKGENEA